MATCEFKSQIDEIILKGDKKVLVDVAQKIAHEMIYIDKKKGGVDKNRSVSTSQIRNIFGTSKKIEMNLDQENLEQANGKLIMLKPKMAYANARFNKDGKKIPGFKVLVDCLSYAIDKIEGKYDRMQSFFDFFEAILAYHKAEGGE